MWGTARYPRPPGEYHSWRASARPRERRGETVSGPEASRIEGRMLTSAMSRAVTGVDGPLARGSRASQRAPTRGATHDPCDVHGGRPIDRRPSEGQGPRGRRTGEGSRRTGEGEGRLPAADAGGPAFDPGGRPREHHGVGRAQRVPAAARAGQGPARQAGGAGGRSRRARRQLPARQRRRPDPRRRRGLRAPAAVGRDRRRARPRRRGVAVPQGLLEPPLREPHAGLRVPAARAHDVRAAAGAHVRPARPLRDPLTMAAAHDDTDPRDRSLGDLVGSLSTQTSTLVRKEIELARVELQEKGKVAGRGAGLLAGGAVFGLLALGALTAALIAVLSLAMDTWIAALIVMALWAIVAAVLAKAGQNALKRATPPAPQTVETVKEDIQWAKNPSGSAPR